MSDDDMLPLFIDGKRTPGPVRSASPASITYRRAASREWCDDCISHSHAAGFTRAPFPRQQRWWRTDASGKELRLCDNHKRDRQASDASS